jgi:predicted Abi (CAAX) family protease
MLKSIATFRPRTLAELAAIPEVRDWQVQDFGEELLKALDRIDPP